VAGGPAPEAVSWIGRAEFGGAVAIVLGRGSAPARGRCVPHCARHAALPLPPGSACLPVEPAVVLPGPGVHH
jgi:hypothetical protein